jgi:hypothetical protein
MVENPQDPGKRLLDSAGEGPEDRGCIWLLISLVGLYLASPYLNALGSAFPWLSSTFFDVLIYTGVLLAGIRAVSDTKKHLWTGVILVVPPLIMSWVGLFSRPTPVLAAVVMLLLLAFLLYTTFLVLSYVLGDGAVTSDRLFGAISVYFLMGHGWALVYMALEMINPGSFAGISSWEPGGAAPELIYYSFVTLTTLGYGEITPVSMAARNLAALQAVGGVLYIATLVARLVALYGGRKR